ncbi:MAG TPA: glycosyl hydrolase [Blastocatellia bacterium]|nr:glycosyl hydrolase [Blastocatellia bacterium]
MLSTRIVIRAFCSLSILLLPFVWSPVGFSQDGESAKTSPFAGLRFREIGPASPAGRIDDFAVLESNPAVFYVATATGGLWKTVNQGTTFTTVFDNEATSSIGDVAIAPSDANLVWVGTGENNNRQSSSWGDGVYKSVDGGKSWKNMGLRDSKHIARIVVDPVDNDVVYVAALGSLWGAGGDRGVFKTTDGGLTWANVLKTDADTGATELVMDPANNKVIYAATYQRRRATWGFNGGGAGSAIYKTADAARSWTKLTQGIPEGAKGRIGLDVYRRNPNIVYARIEHAKESGVYRSEDAGATWAKMSNANPRPMYFSQIRIDPNNDQRIYVLGVQLSISDDGGKTFRNDGAQKIHVDFHAMWINPANSNHLMIGGDGGVGISYDKSKTYVWLKNMPLGQFYHVAYDMKTPFNVCGGLQDNNTWCGPSSVRSASGIGNDEWFVIQGGDGFQAQMDPTDPRILYGESQDGRMSRIDRTTNERKTIRPEPPEGEKPYRWNWDTPMVISPHNPATIFVAANRLFKSTDRGHSWKAISGDLTTNTDRETLDLMGAKGKDITLAKHDGISSYGNLVTFNESPKKAGLYYTGSDDGVISVSRDDGANWSNVTSKVPGLGMNTYVSRVAPSRFDEATVYAAFDGHRLNDFSTYVYASNDYGQSWKSIAGDLPKGQVARTITEDLKNPDVLYLGTESGLFVTFDKGKQWMRVKANLPTVPIYEITLHPRDNAMILATHGRSIWVLDDMTSLQQFAKARGADAYLFEIRPATEMNPAGDRSREFEGDMQFLGKIPEVGAAFTYYLKSPAKKLALTVKDASGAVVRELAGESVKDKTAAGINTVIWNLRVEPLPRPRAPQGGAGGGGGFGGGGLEGPFVLPGAYRVTLKAEDKEVATNSFTVQGDPEIQISAEDRKVWFDTAVEVHRLQKTLNEAADRANELNDKIKAMQQALKENSTAPAAMKSKVEEFAKKFETVAKRFGVGAQNPFETGNFESLNENLRFRFGGLKGGIMGSTSRPTDTQIRQTAEMHPVLEKAVQEANALINALPALLKELADAGIYPAPVKPIGQ